MVRLTLIGFVDFNKNLSVSARSFSQGEEGHDLPRQALKAQGKQDTYVDILCDIDSRSLRWEPMHQLKFNTFTAVKSKAEILYQHGHSPVLRLM